MTNLYTNEPEKCFEKEADLVVRKKFGQFFTPFRIGEIMSEWILGGKASKMKILDPAVGLGLFARTLDKLNNNKKDLHFDFYEKDKNIFTYLQDILYESNIKANFNLEDYLLSENKELYDGIIANPPYYKHHFLENKEELKAKFSNLCRHNFSVQTNVYCWFIIKSILEIKTGGRIAYIVPSEFLNSNYGVNIKEYLLKAGIILHLIDLNFQNQVFDDALTTSVILLGEKSDKKQEKINFYFVDNLDKVESLDQILSNFKVKEYKVEELEAKEKWKNYFTPIKSNPDIEKNLVEFKNFGKFSRGIATGDNNYFTLTPSEVEQYNLPKEVLKPCITKSNHVKTPIFDNNAFEKLIEENKKAYLFDGIQSKNPAVEEYINYGIKIGASDKYLTKKRNPWFSVEKREVAKIWVSVFFRGETKFIWNDTDCLNLTCFHGFIPTIKGKGYLDILFLYLKTDIAKAIFKKETRNYGSGLNKFEPGDISKSKILDLSILSKNEFNSLKQLQLELTSNPKSENNILKEANKILLNASQLATKEPEYLI